MRVPTTVHPQRFYHRFENRAGPFRLAEFNDRMILVQVEGPCATLSWMGLPRIHEVGSTKPAHKEVDSPLDASVHFCLSCGGGHQMATTVAFVEGNAVNVDLFSCEIAWSGEPDGICRHLSRQ